MNNKVLYEVIESLSRSQRQIPSKYFYDEKGSNYFDEICKLEEYYLTRTEIEILKNNIDEIVKQIGAATLLVELGSGSSLKTKILLTKLISPAGYIPVDIAKEELNKSFQTLLKEFPGLKICPHNLDFMKPFNVEFNEKFNSVTYFFPGSTVGNLEPMEAKEFLGRLKSALPGKAKLLIGVDLIKDKKIIERAYNDSKGVTAEFNINILNNINKLTGSDFKLENFKHYSKYNEEYSRIEMYLVSETEHNVKLNGTILKLKKGEKILTEYSYKYSISSFGDLMKDIFNIKKVWTDKNNNFAVMLCS